MAEIKIGKILLGSLATNTYFVYREGENQAIIVDPADHGAYLYQKLRENGIQVAAVFLTHGHGDHIFGVEELVEAAKQDGSKVQVYAMEEEAEVLGDVRLNLSKMLGRACVVKPDILLKDGEKVQIASMTCQVIATPGHTKGGGCFYFEEGNILVSGDTLFLESTGRTDFPTGSMGTLVRSIKEKLFCLPEDTKVYPGHGESTTIGYEKQYNPFCS